MNLHRQTCLFMEPSRCRISKSSTEVRNSDVTLHLYEIALGPADNTDATQLLKEIDGRVHSDGGELIEAQVTREARRIFVIAEFQGEAPRLDSDALRVDSVSGPHSVRLVGADLGIMDRDARRMRGQRPFIFSNLKENKGLEDIAAFIVRQGGLPARLTQDTGALS